MKIQAIVIILSYILLSGCEQQDLGDLKQYVQQIKQTTVEPLEPLPAVSAFPELVYTSARLANPFGITSNLENTVNNFAGNQLITNKTRVREALEFFALDGLTMVGTLSRPNETWALVLDPNGYAHSVQVGDHVGINAGVVTKIDNRKLEIMEIISDNQGSEIRRKIFLQLSKGNIIGN